MINEAKEQVLTFEPYKEFGIDEDVRLVIYNEIKKEFSHLIVIKAKDKCELPVSQLESHIRYTYKYQVKVNKKWTDKVKYKALRVEKLTTKGIKYLFYPVESSDYLIVGFQGISRTPGYNYIRSLKDVKVNRLYIKDDYGSDQDTRTSYYLGPNKTFSIADNVLKLIEDVRISRGIRKENVLCIGSSKGGFASLYFTYRGKYGGAIVGGPQTLLGDYLSAGRLDVDKPNSILRPIFKYLAGDLTEENIKWLNSVLFDAVKESEHEPNVMIHVGKGEPHYKNHVLPFMEFTKELNLKNISLDLGDYEKHDELVQHFPSLLKENILKVIQ
ncbi:hypothetical protein [Bacillus niameyensis]|uniref:hypothetical protein n=1 Tax=Bacillus niameyensis TaxID=1522308 RepID=UPI0007814859|nr:hypothetical protein [Bacillus niameyensis]